MQDFRTPEATRNNVGEVRLNYCFQLDAEFGPRRVSQSTRGGRVYRQIGAGTISGPRLQGKVYPRSGGDYGLIHDDDVEEINERFMCRADNGEWLYFSHVGYRRPDGYHRLQAYFDADAAGPNAWLNDAVMMATAREQGARTVFTYYQAI